MQSQVENYCLASPLIGQSSGPAYLLVPDP